MPNSPARIWNFFGPTSEQIPEIGGHWHDLVRSKCSARLAEKTELMLGCRVFQMDGRGSVYVNENKQGGGDGHEGVNWEFLLILVGESIKGILTSSPFSQTFQSMAAFEI